MLLIVGCVLSCLNVVFFFLLKQNGEKEISVTERQLGLSCMDTKLEGHG